jgi:hypothetical protein
MIAYSSVSHMGFVLLGIAAFTAEGINGAIYQMVSHGILSAMLFLLTGVIYDRTHDRRIDHYRGLIGVMPQIHDHHRYRILCFPGITGLLGLCRRAFHINGRIPVRSALPVWIPHYQRWVSFWPPPTSSGPTSACFSEHSGTKTRPPRPHRPHSPRSRSCWFHWLFWHDLNRYPSRYAVRYDRARLWRPGWSG